MTLDGHIKTGLAATLLLSQMVPLHFTGLFEPSLLPWILLAFFLGNVGPDLTEMGIIPHRTYTHYPWFYLIAIGGCSGALYWDYTAIPGAISWAVIAYCAGCLFHILCDIPYGGIPYIRPTQKVSIMRVPFDSPVNRLIEHTTLCTLLFCFALSHMPNGTIDGWFNMGAEAISAFSEENSEHPVQTNP